MQDDVIAIGRGLMESSKENFVGRIRHVCVWSGEADFANFENFHLNEKYIVEESRVLVDSAIL